MSTLSGTSTNADVAAAYDDNACYAETGSLARAKAFVTACRILLHRRPSQMGGLGNARSFDQQLVQKELERAQDWIVARPDASGQTDNGPRVTRANFSDFRG